MDDLTVVKRALSQAEVQAHFDRAPPSTCTWTRI